MLINCDIKGLEWVCVNWLSQDPVGMREIIEDANVHLDNQEKFGLPSRLIAKIFLFR